MQEVSLAEVARTQVRNPTRRVSRQGVGLRVMWFGRGDCYEMISGLFVGAAFSKDLAAQCIYHYQHNFT